MLGVFFGVKKDSCLWRYDKISPTYITCYCSIAPNAGQGLPEACQETTVVNDQWWDPRSSMPVASVSRAAAKSTVPSTHSRN